MKLLIAKDLNLLRGIFRIGKMSNFLAVGQGFPSSPGFPIKVESKGVTVHTWWVQHFFDIFGKKGDIWHMILGNKPAGHSCV